LQVHARNPVQDGETDSKPPPNRQGPGTPILAQQALAGTPRQLPVRISHNYPDNGSSEQSGNFPVTAPEAQPGCGARTPLKRQAKGYESARKCRCCSEVFAWGLQVRPLGNGLCTLLRREGPTDYSFNC